MKVKTKNPRLMALGRALYPYLHPGGDSAREAEFSLQFGMSSLRQIRVSVVLSLLVYSAFVFVDLLMPPALTTVFILIRFAGYLPLSLLMYLLMRTPFFLRHVQPLLVLFALLAGAGLLAINALASLHGFYGYRYALFFTIIFVFTLLRLRFFWATTAGLVLVAIFNILAWGTGVPFVERLDTNILLVCITLFGIVSVWFMERQEWRTFMLIDLLAREKRRTEDMNRTLEDRVRQRTKELSVSLAELQDANMVLEKAMQEKAEAQEALYANERYARMLFDGGSDPALILEDEIVIDCNAAVLQLLDIPDRDGLIGKNPWLFSPECQSEGINSEQEVRRLIRLAAQTGRQKFEWWLQRRDGSRIPVEVMLTVIRSNHRTLYHALLRDVVERREMQQKLMFLSYHDQMTGIFNRRFYEEEVKRLDVKRNYPLTLLLADVNGLKLVNDAFGHLMGDSLLKAAANVLKAGCRADDIVARLGGDEFILLLPQTDEAEAEDIIRRMHAFGLEQRVGMLNVSISFGYETKHEASVTIQEVFNQAEDRMYRKKLFESPIVRKHTIKTILETLYRRNAREAEHARIVSGLCGKMAVALELNETETENLTMLGRMHDIGKIAMQAELLEKPGSLDVEEWLDLKRHSEVGYRILSTVNEYAEMAEQVLSHHEWWDGRGYPKGTGGLDIPLYARILAIADAYDAMTGERPYRMPIPVTEAREELQRCMGSQFDPRLVGVFLTYVVPESGM